MQIELQREYKINSDVDSLWSFLTDIEKITSCMTNLENLQILSATNFRGKIKPPFSFIKGKLSIECQIVEINEKQSFRLDIKGSSIGATFTITMAVSIISADETKMQVKVKAETFGLLKAIPKSLIQQVVEETEKSMLGCIKEKLELGR